MSNTLLYILFLIMICLIVFSPTQESDLETNRSKEINKAIERNRQNEKDKESEIQERRNWKRKYWTGYTTEEKGDGTH